MACEGLPPLPAQIALERSRKHALIQHHVETIAHAYQYGRTREFQQPRQPVQANHQQGEHEQGGGVVAGQHAVVHLQHVQGRHQTEYVYYTAEGGKAIEGLAKAPCGGKASW